MSSRAWLSEAGKNLTTKGTREAKEQTRNAQGYFLATASTRIVPVLVCGSFLHAARTNSDTTMPAVPTASHDLMRGTFKRVLPCVILRAGKASGEVTIEIH